MSPKLSRYSQVLACLVGDCRSTAQPSSQPTSEPSSQSSSQPASQVLACSGPLPLQISATLMLGRCGPRPLRLSTPPVLSSAALFLTTDGLAFASSYLSGAAALLCPALNRSGISGLLLRSVWRSVVLMLGSGPPGARLLPRSGAPVFGRFGPRLLGCSRARPLNSTDLSYSRSSVDSVPSTSAVQPNHS